MHQTCHGCNSTCILLTNFYTFCGTDSWKERVGPSFWRWVHESHFWLSGFSTIWARDPGAWHPGFFKMNSSFSHIPISQLHWLQILVPHISLYYILEILALNPHKAVSLESLDRARLGAGDKFWLHHRIAKGKLKVELCLTPYQPVHAIL